MNSIQGLVSLILAIISASLSYYFAQKLQINAGERALKEKYYQAYINAVSKVAIDNNSQKAKEEFANEHNRLILIGSSAVVSLAMEFHNYIRVGNSADFTIERHDELLTTLVKAMRNDLYGSKKANYQYPLIHLCGTSKNEKRK